MLLYEIFELVEVTGMPCHVCSNDEANDSLPEQLELLPGQLLNEIVLFH